MLWHHRIDFDGNTISSGAEVKPLLSTNGNPGIGEIRAVNSERHYLMDLSATWPLKVELALDERSGACKIERSIVIMTTLSWTASIYHSRWTCTGKQLRTAFVEEQSNY